jgi:hypothetical protein
VWANSTFSTSFTREGVLSSIQLSPQQLAAAVAAVGAGLLGFLGSAVGGLFSIFTFGMFVFYLSAQMPQLERWVASLFPARSQAVAAKVWTLTAEKTGGYVGARVVLALINAGTTAIVFVAIGMPYWLPLALWTGIVAQFVPTIGTYIAIVLPVVVGLLTPDPWLGVSWGGAAGCSAVRRGRRVPSRASRGDAVGTAEHLRTPLRAPPRDRRGHRPNVSCPSGAATARWPGNQRYRRWCRAASSGLGLIRGTCSTAVHRRGAAWSTR